MSADQTHRTLLASHPLPEIGDLFWPSESAATRSLLDRPGLSLSYNARGALLEVGQELMREVGGRDEVLVPAFHCPSGITPLIEVGLKPVYYRIRPDLSLDFDDLLAKVSTRTRAVVVIHFFGFETELSPLQALRSQEIALVEDWSHSFLQVAPLRLPRPQGDYQVFSFWKLVPCGVGGGLLRLSQPDLPGWQRRTTSWREGIVRFKRELEEVFEHSPQALGGTTFRKLENLRLALQGKHAATPANTGSTPAIRGEDRYAFDRSLAVAGMPGSVRRRLFAADLADVAARRRLNYSVFSSRLPTNDCLRPVRRELPGNACPWVFPVLLKDRDRIDHQWRSAGVPLHTFGIWLHSGLAQTDAATRDDATLLARELLCLSIHQGLSTGHLEQASDVIVDHIHAELRHAA